MTKRLPCDKIRHRDYCYLNYEGGKIRDYYMNISKNSEKINSQITQISAFSGESDKFSSLSTSSMLAKAGVPQSHIIAADNYMFIKKIYGTPVVKSRINNKEKAILAKYDFNQLEYTTIKQINEELSLLKKWSMSLEENLKNDSDAIIEIRLKELKYLAACRYTLITNELYNGYLALEKYFEDISKYSL